MLKTILLIAVRLLRVHTPLSFKTIVLTANLRVNFQAFCY